MLRVNENEISFQAGMTLADLLRAQGDDVDILLVNGYPATLQTVLCPTATNAGCGSGARRHPLKRCGLFSMPGTALACRDSSRGKWSGSWGREALARWWQQQRDSDQTVEYEGIFGR